MSTRLHLALGIAAEAAGMVLAFALFARFATDSEAPGPALVLLFLAGCTAGVMLPRAAFRLIPARCGRCGGPAYRRGGRRIIYACRACGRAHDTGVREGGRRVWPPL